MMETSVTNGMCRCCASEGAFKDVKSSYHWMGQEEVYGDMLRECFDLSLSISEGEQGSICELCITQLRNAVNFKKQVLHTEEQFKTRLQNKLFKTSIVKVELSGDDDNDSGDNNMSGDDDYSGPDFEVPIKTESPDEPKSKKRAVKATTSSTKRTKTNVGETSTKRDHRQASAHTLQVLTKLKGLNITLKRPISLDAHQLKKVRPIINEIKHMKVKKKVAKKEVSKIETLKKEDIKTEGVKTDNIKKEKGVESCYVDDLEKMRRNTKEILLSSNATPIRSYNDKGFLCCFCKSQYQDPADLKKHTLETHEEFRSIFMFGKSLNNYLVKLDITSLKCNQCKEKIDTLEELIPHLKHVHDKKVYTDIKNHILPFKFSNDLLMCALCAQIFSKFNALQKHMSCHYSNYVCDICGAGFVNLQMVTLHKNYGHRTGAFKCEYCPKSFNTIYTKNTHVSFIHLKLCHKCSYCKEKFKNYDKKTSHLAEVHGIIQPMVDCKACGKSFRKQTLLNMHIKKDHLMEKRHQCTECEMEFFSKYMLKEHMVKHNGVRQYHCEVCSKSFVRKRSLREHIRIHTNDRRFKCEICGQAFVQKCSMKGHMRSKHGITEV